MQFTLNRADLKLKYDELLLQHTSGIARKSASTIVNKSIEVFTDDVYQAIEDESAIRRELSFEHDSTLQADGAVITPLSPLLEQQGTGKNEVLAAPSNVSKPSASLSLIPDSSCIDPTTHLMHFMALNQEVEWVVEKVDLVQKFREFRVQNLQDFSLARDGIADMTVFSKFRSSLAPNIGRVASRVEPISNLHEQWPTLAGVLERVFAENHYDSVKNSITGENMKDCVVQYIMSIVYSYIPTDINERQGFVDLTWCFIRGAMTITGLETRYLEVLITGVQERKNWTRDGLTEAKQMGQFADGATIWEGSQLYLSEASSIHNAKAEKLRQDEFKLARAMRDTWISQVKAISKHSIPRRGMAVFGSSTFNDETKFWRLDFCGVFRLIHFDTFFVPLKKSEFGKKAKEAVLQCLTLALRIKAEVSAREEKAKPVDHELRELLLE
ncbi:hypothetical protein BGW41_007131, partial [Actinomortierella wolfii]